MQEINAVIDSLELGPHPEGGFYREMHRASYLVTEANGNSKNAYSSIYYLLSGRDFSAWHMRDLTYCVRPGRAPLATK
jgi:predicted cupin superfamily sugar epimerase